MMLDIALRPSNKLLLGRCLQVMGGLLSCASTGPVPGVLCPQVAACGAETELCSAAVLDAPTSCGPCAHVRELLSTEQSVQGTAATRPTQAQALL